MRIHLYGNVLNWGFQFGRYLRALGHDAHLFLDAHEPVPMYRPEWEPAGGAANDWVHPVNVRLGRMLVPGRDERAFLRQLGDCDVIQTFGEFAIAAWRTGTPYVVLSYGGDLEVMPFARGGVREVVLGRLLLRAFARASAFVYAIPSHRPIVARLGLANASFNPHAVPVDTDWWAPASEADRAALRGRHAESAVFFHGARQEWVVKDSNEKGNDRLFRGFARFLAERPDALLIAAERGRDVGASKALVRELGIEDRVRWIAELRKTDLRTMLNSVDGFFDQFVHGYYGVATLEALACGVPTCVRLKPAAGVVLPPALDASSEEEIAAAMHRCATPGTRADLGAAARAWTVARHGWVAVMGWYLGLYERAVSGGGRLAAEPVHQGT